MSDLYEIACEFQPLIESAYIRADQADFDEWNLRLFYALSDATGLAVVRIRFDEANFPECFATDAGGCEVWWDLAGCPVDRPPPLERPMLN